MPQINGVAIPGFWLSREYVAEKQGLSRRTPEPKWAYCDACGDPYRKQHHCVFDPRKENDNGENAGHQT